MLNEDVRKQWARELAEFTENVYPAIFQPHGFTFAQAFLSWQLNHLTNETASLRELIADARDEEEHGEEWKPKDGE